MELSISNDFQVEESSQYPKIDMKAVRIGLAEQIESSNLLETSMADGLETLKQGDQTPNLLFGGNSSGYLRIMGADNIDTISISVETKTIQLKSNCQYGREHREKTPVFWAAHMIG